MTLTGMHRLILGMEMPLFRWEGKAQISCPATSLQLRAGAEYYQVNKVQRFTSTSFMDQVLSENCTITVVPNGAAPDPEPKGVLRYRVLEGLDTLSRVSTSMFLSLAGEAFVINRNNHQAQRVSLLGVANQVQGDPIER